MKVVSVFFLFCLIASLKMPDRAAGGRHRRTDTIPFRLSCEPCYTHVRWDFYSYTFYDSTGNSISIKDSTEVVIKGDTAKAVLGLFKMFETINKRSYECNCELRVKYFRKGKLVKTAGGSNGYLLYGKDLAEAPFKIGGKEVKTDSILFHAVPK